MRKQSLFGTIALSAIALVILSGFAIAASVKSKGTSIFSADLSGNAVTDGFSIVQEDSLRTKDRIYTGTFSSSQLGSGTFSIVEESNLASESGQKNPDGLNKGSVAIYLTSTELGVKKLYGKFNGKLDYDKKDAGTVLWKGNIEILGGADASNNFVKLAGKGTYDGSSSSGNLNLHITGFYKIVSES